MDWKYENGRIYSTDEKDELMCETTFICKENGEMDIDHTYVNPVLRGQSVAGKMMEVVAEYFRKEGIKATATCSYANIWLKRHEKQYPDILSEDTSDQAVACKIDGTSTGQPVCILTQGLSTPIERIDQHIHSENRRKRVSSAYHIHNRDASAGN